MVGQRVSHYYILEKLGAGGMGVVYKAEDRKLRRVVALKFVSGGLANDPESQLRFQREAYAASALNHAHICTVYDVDTYEGQPFIAMEFLEGQTLDRIIAAGPMDLFQILEFSLQITDALDVAHGKGILHRDIKPGNILISPRGQAKLLDFGLAKWTPKSAESELTGATIPLPITGSPLLGTPAYMSPEQVRGEELDARSDLFSFGAVLYEVATGRRAFEGATVAVVFDAILNRAPRPAAEINPQIDPRIERIIRKAVQNNPDSRYQTAADMKSDLAGLRHELELAVPSPSRRRFWAWAVPVMLVFLVFAFLLYFARRSDETALRNATFTQLSNMSGVELFPSVASDGRFVIYASRGNGNWDVYLQRVGGQNPTNLTSDSPADDTQPSLSSDESAIAFRSERDGGGIFVMGATGESPRRITTFGYNPTWSPDGRKLAFAGESVIDDPNDRTVRSSIWTVDIASGDVVRIFEGDGVQPAWSSQGNRIAYWSRTNAGQRDIWTMEADGKNPVPVTNDAALDWSPAWSPDGKYLYFSSDESGNSHLWRVPIDERSGRVLGPRQAVTTGGGAALRAHVNVSRNGKHIAYVEQVIANDTIEKVPFDAATGQVTGLPTPLSKDARPARHPEPSPDGRWISYMSWGKQEDIFLVRRDGTGQRQLTNDEFKDRIPRWSPDGSSIAFYSNRSGKFQMWTIHPDGSGLEQLTHYSGAGRGVVRTVWSPDGRRVAIYVPEDGMSIIELDNSGHIRGTFPIPPPNDPDEIFDVWSWSPDGRWLAGSRRQLSSGIDIGVAIYDLEKHEYQTLTDFGTLPIWFKDSRRLLYDSKGQIFVVDRISRKAEKVFAYPPHTIWNLGQFPPDERSLYFGVLTREADIWLMTLK